MPKDPEKQFRDQVQATIKALKAKGRQPSVTTDSRGTTITGWRFELKKNWRDDKQYNWDNGHGGFEETWGEDWVILTADGKFYYHSHYHEEKRAGRGEPFEKDDVNTLRQMELRELAGNQGAPFSNIIAKLKRFSY